MKLTSALVLALLYAVPASATPILTVSWDGNPPGNLSQITGITDFQIGGATFGPGTYTLTIDGGVTAWWTQNRIGFRPGAGEFLMFPGLGSIVLTTPTPWTLTATTPSMTGALSTGPQWAFWQITPNQIGWGFEDIQLPGGDADYQDAYGTLTRRGGTIDPHRIPTVPEPSTWTLVGLGAALLAWRRLSR